MKQNPFQGMTYNYLLEVLFFSKNVAEKRLKHKKLNYFILRIREL